MSHLFSPWQIGELKLDNRIVIAPMAQYSAKNGSAGDWHTLHLGRLALAGAGLLILEATAVLPEGRVTPVDLGLYSDDNESALGRVLDVARAYSPVKVAIQLGHAGRKASSQVPWEGGKQIRSTEPEGWRGIAPSAVPHGPEEEAPIELDSQGMARIIDGFAEAAKRAARLGIDGIEIHAAHGYLLHEYLSPLSNHRTDAYGGSLDNRMRFPLEVFDAVRAAFPAERPVWVRVSATDWVDGGWDVKSTVEFVRALRARGCDAAHVSTGGVSPLQRIALGPGYQVEFAQQVKSESGLPTIAVGLITEPDQAEAIVADGQADAVALGRGVLYDPHWPWHAAAALGGQVDAPRQYWRSQPSRHKALFRGARTGMR
ncbi:NADH:flavin oxidoreductase/NADH oxidase [Bradyrhizobium pachyrhizi]|uniref:NADH:flavin oxidoreductase/NADH oxidase n=1 Tax=Bradyrhizobium pachyrhizi TaxID=280333 RepID=UPI003D361D32